MGVRTRVRPTILLTAVLGILLIGGLTGCAGPSTTAPPAHLAAPAAQNRPASAVTASQTATPAPQTETITPAPVGAAPTNPPKADPPQTPQQVAQVNLIQARVTRVVDGDTAWVRMVATGDEEKVRFIGVDTPENTTRVEPYGAEASKYAKNHLNGATVYLETDVEPRDRYGRLLAYVWMSEPQAGDADERPTLAEAKERMFNAWLARDGYAQTLTIPPNVKYEDYFLELQRSAREADIGLWNPALVAKPKGDKPGSGPYVGNRNSDKFHESTCRWVSAMSESNKVGFKSRQAAIEAGYVPCKVCNP